MLAQVAAATQHIIDVRRRVANSSGRKIPKVGKGGKRAKVIKFPVVGTQ